MKYVLKLGLCFATTWFASCASYTQQSEKVRAAVYDHNYDAALEKIEKSELSKAERDKVLFHLERGTIFYLKENYKDAAKEWSAATRRMEELYTISVSSQAASLAVNESYSDYEGEEHEKILSTVFTALAYFANNEPNKAIVEARKTNELFKVLNREASTQSNYNSDSFAHYLAGLIYESKMEWDAAIVEYRLGLDAARENKTWYGNVSAKPIAESLGRLAEFRRRSELVSQLKSEFPGITWTPMQKLAESGEVFVVYEAGRSPIKYPEDVAFPISGSIVRLSFPAYRDVHYSSHGSSVWVDGQNRGRTVIVQDIGELAKKALSERRGKDLARMAARVIAKDQAARAVGRNLGPFGQLAASIVGAVTETADTRGWTLLPDTVQILRVQVPANKETRVLISPDAGKPKEVVLKLRPGEKRLIRHRTFY